MSDVATALASTVIFLFSASSQGIVPIGTAFIIGYPMPDKPNTFFPFVVTAKHVVSDNHAVIGRFSPKSGEKPISVLYDVAP